MFFELATCSRHASAHLNRKHTSQRVSWQKRQEHTDGMRGPAGVKSLQEGFEPLPEASPPSAAWPPPGTCLIVWACGLSCAGLAAIAPVSAGRVLRLFLGGGRGMGESLLSASTCPISSAFDWSMCCPSLRPLASPTSVDGQCVNLTSAHPLCHRFWLVDVVTLSLPSPIIPLVDVRVFFIWACVHKVNC